MSSTPEFIDRKDECDKLNHLLARGRPQLALLTGRRRIGKTFLLTHAWPDEQVFLFTAARTTPEINRRQMLQDLSEWSGEDIREEDHPTWRSVFNLILDFRKPDPVVIVLDEFQYLADNSSGVADVASELNAAWERKRSPRPFVLVISGSAVGTMEALAAGGGPLYGRFTWQHRLQPFNYWHTAEMVPFRNLRDRTLAYGIFGGTPRYLASVNIKQSLAQNVTRLLLHPDGEVRTLIETALDQEEGLRDVSKYRAILRAIASGCTERNEIAQRTGLSNDTGLRDKLNRLIELDYIERRQNIDARKNDPALYGIADSAFRFHQRFVEPATSMLERYPASEVWQKTVFPDLDAYMGREFERVAMQAYDRRYDTLSLPLVDEWGRWEGIDRNRLSMEIDIVAKLAGGGILTGSVKWNTRPIGSDIHWAHRDMLKRAAEAGKAWAHKALETDSPILYVAAGGFAPDFKQAVARSDQPVICWNLEDLYTP